jgi:HEAT repeat protein
MIVRATAPNPETAHPEQKELAELVAFLQLAHRQFQLALVGYERPGQRDRLLVKLRRLLPADWKLAEVSLQDPQLDLLNLSPALLKALHELAVSRVGGEPDVVCLLDWEQRLDSATSLVSVFMMWRNLLPQIFPYPLVVFVPETTLTALRHQAPDFVSWRSAEIFFPARADEVQAQLTQALQAARSVYRGDQAALHQVAQLAERIADAMALDDPTLGKHAPSGETEANATIAATTGVASSSPELLAEALAGLGDIFLLLGEYTQAEARFEELARFASRYGLSQWEQHAQRGRRKATRRPWWSLLSPRLPPAPVAPPWEVLRGAAPLTEADDLLRHGLGRERDIGYIRDMIGRPAFRVGTLWGETGCGKTSLVRAGLIRALRLGGYLPVYLDRYEPEANLCQAMANAATGVRPGSSLVETVRYAIENTKKTVVLLCDQFERVFTQPKLRERSKREALLRSLADCVNDRALAVSCLLIIRADQLHHVADLAPFMPALDPLAKVNRYKLDWLRAGDAERVLRDLKLRLKTPWSEDLIRAVIGDLARQESTKPAEAEQTADGLVNPVQVQLVAAGLYLANVATLAAYDRIGRVQGLLKNYLNGVFDWLAQCKTPSHSVLGRQVVHLLVLPGTPPTRLLLTAKQIAEQICDRTAKILGVFPKQVTAKQYARRLGGMEKKIQPVLNGLVEAHVLQLRQDSDAPSYELVHDVLAEPALRATALQEMGLGILRVALLREHRLLRFREYRVAKRCDLAELPEEQRPKARRLLRRSGVVWGAALATAAACVLFLLVTALQFSTMHIVVEPEPPQPLVVCRGIPLLRWLPGFLHGDKLFDTGLTLSDIASEKNRQELTALSLPSWSSLTRAQALGLTVYLNAEAQSRWRCYLGDWDFGLRMICSGLERQGERRKAEKEFSAAENAVLAVDPERASSSLLDLLTDPNKDVRVSATTLLVAVMDQQADVVMPKLLDLLHDPDSNVRAAAAKVLGLAAKLDNWDQPVWDRSVPKAVARSLGSLGVKQANVVVPKVLDLLRDPKRERGFRQKAAQLLEFLGTKQADVVAPRLLDLLRDPDWFTRDEAARLLGPLGAKQAGVIVPKLLGLLRHPDGPVRVAAARLLGPLGAKQADVIVPKLLDLLHDSDRFVREAAARSLGSVGAKQAGVVVPKLLDLLRDPDSNVRAAAAEALGSVGVKQADVVPKLLDLLRDPDSNVRAAAARSLGSVDAKQADVVVPKLLDLLRDPDRFVRAAAAEALGSVGAKQADVVVPKLLDLLRDPDSKLCAATVEALESLGAKRAEVVVPCLLNVPRDADWSVRREATRLLGSVGAKQADVVVPKLLDRFYDPDRLLREAAAKALEALNAKQADVVVPKLLDLLRDPKREKAYHEAAARLLESLGAKQADIVAPTQLPDRLSDSDRTSAVYEAARLLGSVGAKQADVVVPELLGLLRDPDRDVRAVAARSLGSVGAKQADVVVPKLLDLLRDPDRDFRDRDVRAAAVEALGSVGAKQADVVVPKLLDLLRDPDRVVRWEAATALGQIADNQPARVNLLIELVRDSDESVRRAAIQVLTELWFRSATETRSAGPVSDVFLGELRGNTSQLNAGYRQAIVLALARWYNLGQSPDSKPKVEPELRQQAQSEYAALHAQLTHMRDHEPRLWLRIAACEVLSEAYRLR